ncbi:MAG: recombinase family protein [Bryobacteraceae bacterium]|nr:recombinase family protein [Bryobacteraceae bacterium]
MIDAQTKIQAGHRKRNAYLYIRQSTPRQVLEHQESTQRQYGLRQQALRLGWSEEQIVVIDTDLGQSGASAADRVGFQRLVTEVSLGRAGLVLGLEVSRLARNCSDWHRLLEICAFTGTLILDEDGLYDPAQFNDRLLLGLKGTMSEAELHLLRARLRGGALNKAKRGELQVYLPIGLAYDAVGRVVVDPDEQVRHSVQLVFATFQRTGSAFAVVREFRRQGWLFPRHKRTGPDHEQVVWKQLSYPLVIKILHNPRYAGAFVYGRTTTRKSADGQRGAVQRLPVNEWQVLIKDAHHGYLSWEQYEANLSRLRENTAEPSTSDRRSAPREGPALLQGVLLCGVCGQRMHPRYTSRGRHLWPYYLCPRQDLDGGRLTCQHISGKAIDDAMGELLLTSITPVALEVALAVQQEISNRLEEADRLRRAQVERARYEASLAQRRYIKVDPDNRLVADTLETEWNNRLRLLAEAEQNYERQRHSDDLVLNDEQTGRILALATNFRQVWENPALPHRERKRMVRLLIEDVTVVKRDSITLHVRFRSGATQSLTIPAPLDAWHRRRTSDNTVEQIDKLLDDHTCPEIAGILNSKGLPTGTGMPFTADVVDRLIHGRKLRSRQTRLREKGYLTLPEAAAALGISTSEVCRRRNQGLLTGLRYGINKYMYEPPLAWPCNNLAEGVAV